MSQTISRPTAVLGPALRQHAAWLARLWRLSPLTLLLHDDDRQAETLMKEGLLPLTARRGIDRHLGGETPLVAVSGADREPERVLQLDASRGHDPLARLRYRLQALLPAKAREGLPAAPDLVEVVRAAQAHGVGRLLIAVHQLDTLLAPRNDDPAPRQALCDALIALLSAPQLSIHVLLVVNEQADVLLGTLRRALPQLDDHRLRVSGGTAPLQPAAATQSVASEDGFQRSLNAMLLRVAHFDAPMPHPAAVPAAPATPATPATPAAPIDAVAPTAPLSSAVPAVPPSIQPPPSAAAPQRRSVSVGLLAGASLGLVALLGLGLLWQPQPGPAPTVAVAPPAAATAPASAPARAPARAPSPSVVPAPTVAVTPPTASAELQAALAGTGLRWLQAQGDADWADALRRLATAPGLAQVRYDALQAARRWADAPALQVLAPLYLDPVLFLVREDSARRALHELGSARINQGPADGARALALAAVWRGLFDRDLPVAQADPTPAGQALAALRAGRVDAVAWVGAMPPDAKGLRLLALDPGHPSTALLQQRFLLATQPDATPGLALMNFLVSSAQTPAEALRDAARRLCAALPALRSTGQRVWQTVAPLPPLPTGWPDAPAAIDEFKRCAASAQRPDTRVSQQPSTTRSP